MAHLFNSREIADISVLYVKDKTFMKLGDIMDRSM